MDTRISARGYKYAGFSTLQILLNAGEKLRWNLIQQTLKQTFTIIFHLGRISLLGWTLPIWKAAVLWIRHLSPVTAGLMELTHEVFLNAWKLCHFLIKRGEWMTIKSLFTTNLPLFYVWLLDAASSQRDYFRMHQLSDHFPVSGLWFSWNDLLYKAKSRNIKLLAQLFK